MRDVELHMPATPKAVPELRHRLYGYDYDVRLCATELLTNVIEHVGDGTPVRVRLVAPDGPGRTRVEVTDPDPRRMPALLSAAETAECGRGLVLVAALAERWGVERGPGGKTVWCEVVRGRGAADFGEVVPRAHRHQDVEPDGEPGGLQRVEVDSVAE
ncbi:ATP-binding protein [Streptomyces griseofuscus]|uniref:Histidine kinase-like ATPase domain protein n=1 Tax=Streptomyces griseofuscus TaxID=146922 RepID=A0A7H1Q629_9ACTN|nr:ATP-binding protein [Streptomyces griseofuscus]QNT95759.1 Histidine kinase-like ATPase domain protein [Streptomyces griseofuscus]BBC96387.1 ATP-binding protein [Streptomyces rochei]